MARMMADLAEDIDASDKLSGLEVRNVCCFLDFRHETRRLCRRFFLGQTWRDRKMCMSNGYEIHSERRRSHQRLQEASELSSRKYYLSVWVMAPACGAAGVMLCSAKSSAGCSLSVVELLGNASSHKNRVVWERTTSRSTAVPENNWWSAAMPNNATGEFAASRWRVGEFAGWTQPTAPSTAPHDAP